MNTKTICWNALEWLSLQMHCYHSVFFIVAVSVTIAYCVLWHREEKQWSSRQVMYLIYQICWGWQACGWWQRKWMPWRTDTGSSNLEMSMGVGFQRETSQSEICERVVGGTGDKVTILKAYVKYIKRIKLRKWTQTMWMSLELVSLWDWSERQWRPQKAFLQDCLLTVIWSERLLCFPSRE